MAGGIIGIAAALAIGGLAALLLMRKRMGGRPLPESLRSGKPLPGFTARDEQGKEVSSGGLRGAPAVILFVRGNWCPFCSRQVANLTRHYRRINELGARLILVTPEPLETTRRVAEFFDFDFEFWLDHGLAAGSALGLVQKNGVPEDYRAEYGDDTLWPAALVVDADGVIRYATVSKLIADRPNPAKLVRALEALRD